MPVRVFDTKWLAFLLHLTSRGNLVTTRADCPLVDVVSDLVVGMALGRWKGKTSLAISSLPVFTNAKLLILLLTVGISNCLLLTHVM